MLYMRVYLPSIKATNRTNDRKSPTAVKERILAMLRVLLTVLHYCFKLNIYSVM